MENFGIADGGILALLGYGVVFLGIVLLMVLVMAIGKVFSAKDKKKTAPAPAPVEEAAPAPVASGTAGELKLHDVEPKIAAMLMAIVADKMGKPLNELRFISVKEVK